MTDSRDTPGEAGPWSRFTAFLLGRRSARRVWWLTLAMLAAGIGITVFLVDDLAKPAVPLTLSWWVFALIVAVIEFPLIHLYIRSEAHSFTLGELALCLGLFLVPPEHFILGAVVGATVAKFRLPPIKLAFNAALWVLQASVAVVVFQRIANPVDPFGGWGVVATFASMSLVGIIGVVAVFAAISLVQGGVRAGPRAQAARIAAPVTVANTGLGLIAAYLVTQTPHLVFALLGPVAVLFLTYRAFIVEHQQHQRLRVAYQATRSILEAPELSLAIASLLAQAREVLRADIAQIVLYPERDDEPILVSTAGPGDHLPEVRSVGNVDDTVFAGVTLTRRSERLDSKELAHRGGLIGIDHEIVRGTIVAPLEGDRRVVGAIAVANRFGEGTFDTSDLLLLETLAGHAGVAIGNGRLEARVVARTAELEASERRFRALVHHSSDVVTVIDRTGVVIYQADSIESVFGYRPDDLVGRSILTLTGLEAADYLREQLELASRDTAGGVRTLEVELRHASGRRRHAEMTVTNLLDAPDVGGLVLNTRDVSERRELERRLVHDAFHDTLTHLPNRSLFLDRLSHALNRAVVPGDVAILFIDLDGFKKINDTMGHAAGDQLLVDVALMLQDCLRPGDTVARLGGDEFAILVEDAGDDFGAVAVAERVCTNLRRKLSVQGQDVFLTASVGVAVAEEGSDGDGLLRSADLAMYRAKEAAEGGFALYDPGMHQRLLERVRLEGELRDALDADQLVLHYQPTFELASGRLVGFEALVRWEHPERGLMQPGMFIPIAEETGLIHQISRIVLREACRQGAAWVRLHPELSGMSLAVNLSASDLRDPSLSGYLTECLFESGLPSGCLVLEMTETMLIEHSVQMIEQLQQLKALGVRLAIDDFGTGFSSLSYLHRFPVDILKIDRSFVERVTSASDSEFVRTIVQLSRSLSMTTVAEGIEDHEQLVALRLAGCELGQGFHFSPAVPSAMVEEHLPDWVSGVAPSGLLPADPPGPGGPPDTPHRGRRALVPGT